jgi:hypothetical protein
MSSLEDIRKKLAVLHREEASEEKDAVKKSNITRAKKLKAILRDLKKGKHVQNRILQTWLTENEYAEYLDEWESQQAIRNQIKDKPLELAEYERRLKKGIFLENKSNRFSKRDTKQVTTLLHQSQTEFEGALEYLGELLDRDPMMAIWFDRQLDLSANGNISLSSSGMPRVITSRSADNSGGGILLGKLSKQQVKTAAVEKAIDKLKEKRR